jgi:competence protein ComEC
MKDIFTPVFLTAFFSLLLFNSFDIYHETIYPFMGLFFFLALGFYWLKKFRAGYLCITIAISLLLVFLFLKQKYDYNQLADIDIPENEYVSVTGELVDFPEISEDFSVIVIKTSYLEFEQKKISRSFRMRIKVKGNLDHLTRGDGLVIQAKMVKNRFIQNFYKNPREDYLFYKNIHFSGYSKSDQLVQVQYRSGFFWRILGGWRNKVRQIINKKFRTRQDRLDKKGVFLEAILLGERGKLRSEQKQALLSAGIFHLFAISGAHIGIIALLLLLILKLFGFNSHQRYFITMGFLILFLALSGFRISAQRAVIIAVLIFLGRILYQDQKIFNLISFSGIIILIRNPAEILDPGFVLTYTLTAAIVLGRDIFGKWLRKIPLYLKELISANFSAGLIALPLSLFYFKRYSFAGILAGVFMLPLTAIIIGLGILAIIIAPVSGSVSYFILLLNDIPLRLFFLLVDLFSQVVNLNIFRASPSFFLVMGALIVFSLIPLKSYFRFQKLLLISLFCLFLFLMTANLGFYKPDRMEVYFLDVGQGDSELVVFPGGDSLLIDGGGSYFSDFEVGKNIILPFLLQKKIRVRWVAVSHYHPDHCRGIAEILNIVNPDELWISSEARENLCFIGLLNSLNSRTQVKRLSFPFSFKIGEVCIEIVHPENCMVSDYTHNNLSQVIRISDPYHSFLFTGDIETEIESFLVQNRCSALKADVLKVPHHGSNTSSSESFLSCVNAKLAVYSFARNNRFGFPHIEVRKRVRYRDMKSLFTATRGGIKVVSRPEGLKIEVSK